MLTFALLALISTQQRNSLKSLRKQPVDDMSSGSEAHAWQHPFAAETCVTNKSANGLLTEEFCYAAH